MAAPSLFRIILQVADLDEAEAFYGTLLGDRGRSCLLYTSDAADE